MFLHWFRRKRLTMASGTGWQNSACNCMVCYAVGRLGESMALEKKYSFLPVSQKKKSVEYQTIGYSLSPLSRIIKLALLYFLCRGTQYLFLFYCIYSVQLWLSVKSCGVWNRNIYIFTLKSSELLFLRKLSVMPENIKVSVKLLC